MLSATVAARHGDEAILDTGEVAADQREQVGRLREGIVPDGEMAAAGEVAGFDEIAVGEQHRRVGFVGLDARRVDRQHVRPVEEIGDAAKALGLALGAIGAAGAVEPHQLRIGGRIDQRHDFKTKRPVRRLRDDQAVRRRRVGVCRRGRAIDGQSCEFESVAIEQQRCRRGGLRIGPHVEGRAYSCRRRMKRNVEIDGLDQPIGRAIILQADRAGLLGAHSVFFFLAFRTVAGP